MKPSNAAAFDPTDLSRLSGKKGKARSTYKPEHSLDFGGEEDRQTAQRSLDRFYEAERLREKP